jgi:N-acetyl-anhydromuramyl-L-alanine amidase AmpD
MNMETMKVSIPKILADVLITLGIAQNLDPKTVTPQVNIKRESPNVSTRAGTKIDMIVLHNTAGDFEPSVSWLCNPKAEASAHLVISREGTTAQLVPFAAKAWHAGHGATNSRSIGIEIVATKTERGMTDIQEQVVIAWCKQLIKEYGIGIANIIPHRAVRSTDCPSLIWPTDEAFDAWKKAKLA